MYFALAIFASVIGLLVTAASVYTVWFVIHTARSRGQQEERPQGSALERVSPYLLRWTAMDYAGVLLTGSGLVFLLADLIGVMREREQYPYYHYGYLACGFVFLLIAFLFMLARLSVVLRLARKHGFSAPDDGDEPDQADHPEQRV